MRGFGDLEGPLQRLLLLGQPSGHLGVLSVQRFERSIGRGDVGVLLGRVRQGVRRAGLLLSEPLRRLLDLAVLLAQRSMLLDLEIGRRSWWWSWWRR